uniref:Uncharacterized protein n=1 Tax=Tetradesmus obliquus TaxID=3088 RepID=A0A383VSH5_TETOB|eukprot:jgi/Sobl393_1/3864/SZX67863.1
MAGTAAALLQRVAFDKAAPLLSQLLNGPKVRLAAAAPPVEGSTAFEGPKLRIKLARTGDLDAAAAAPLVAAAYLVRMYSAVAMQLPETDEWDLSGLLLDGQPFRADILSAAHAYRPDPEVPAEQQDAFRQQVAAQTERLLWLSYKLQLEPLIQRLHAFIQSSTRLAASLLHCAPTTVFTPRVLDAAGVASLPGGKRMLMNSVMGEVAQIAGLLGDTDDAQTLLQPQGLTQAQRQPLKFDAVVVRSGLPVASGVTVPVELDLFRTSQIKLGQQVYPVQLRIGRYIQSDS